ncbi:MAG: hypothetical protein HC933_00445 [Pleurocapsa sp. SU_196_0]|nr:hypothetical protein [Pleurocapsa sp. SU_196_0]
MVVNFYVILGVFLAIPVYFFAEQVWLLLLLSLVGLYYGARQLVNEINSH